MNGKWKRRFIGPSWMMLGIFLFSMWQGAWHNWFLLCLPIMISGLCNGYGAEKTWDKIRRRALYGLVLSVSGIPIVIFSHLWVLFGFSVFISVVSCVVLGVWNPCKNAREEETLIATLSFLLILFLI